MKAKTFFVKTFWCQMNYADSEKIHMILLSSGLRKVLDPTKADIIILNTCSVRQKGEDRVFGFIHEVEKFHKKNATGIEVLFGVTGCMVRKSGIARRYLLNTDGTLSDAYARDNTQKITLLESSNGIYNYDDTLFIRSPDIDFVFRIEEVGMLTKILSSIYKEEIGNDAKFHEYLSVKQLQENPTSANVIIQTWCDNFCSFCIVPYTRGREVSREKDDIIQEIRDIAKNGTKEITLLGQNVNSYWKETKKKLWNTESLSWKLPTLNIAIDLDDTLYNVWNEDIIPLYNERYNANISFADIKTHNFNWDENIRNIFFEKYYASKDTHPYFENAFEILMSWKQAGHTLYVITSRPQADKEFTLKRIEKDFWNNFFERVLFTSEYDWDNKADIAKKYSIDITIEDAPHHIEAYKKAGIQSIIFTQPWNNDIEIGETVFRANNWHEVDTIIKKISSQKTFKTPFRELLEGISTVEGIDRIRFTSSNPHDMTKDILDAHFDLPHMCNYLHFALQSGSNSLLKKMNRKHTYEDFKAQVAYLRSRDPLFAISTDIIVGFPGETEQQFQETVQAMKELDFDFAYIARYSSRSGTTATKIYEDNISNEEKARRWDILNSLLKDSVAKRASLMIGRIEEVLITWPGKDDTLAGRTRNFKEVYIPVNPAIRPGDIVKVKILEFDRWVLKGEAVGK